jgi:hypothetical protein
VNAAITHAAPMVAPMAARGMNDVGLRTVVLARLSASSRRTLVTACMLHAAHSGLGRLFMSC